MVVPEYLKYSTISTDLLCTFTLLFRPAFWSRDMIIVLLFSEFTSKLYIIANLKFMLAEAVYIQGMMSDAIKYHILRTAHCYMLA